MEPTLQCRPVVDLGLSSYGIPSEGIHVSGLEEGYEKDWVRLESQVRKAIHTVTNIFFDEIGSNRLRKCDNGTFRGRVGAAQRNTLIILSSTLACRPYSHVGRL